MYGSQTWRERIRSQDTINESQRSVVIKTKRWRETKKDYDKECPKQSYRVTRKHWPPVHSPPLRTGSTDYLRTDPRTTSTDSATDHPQNRIKNKNKDFTYFNHSCRRNFERYTGKNVTDLGSVSGASFIITDHYAVTLLFAVVLHERPGTLGNVELSFPPPFCLANFLARSRARPSLHSSSLDSRRGSHGWTVRINEYESLLFFCLFVLFVFILLAAKDVILGRPNLFRHLFIYVKF